MQEISHIQMDQRLDELRRELHEIMDRKIQMTRSDLEKETEKARKSLKISAQIFFGIAIGTCGLGVTILGWFINDIGKRVDTFSINFRQDLKDLQSSVNTTSENVANIKGRLENAGITK